MIMEHEDSEYLPKVLAANKLGLQQKHREKFEFILNLLKKLDLIKIVGEGIQNQRDLISMENVC